MKADGLLLWSSYSARNHIARQVLGGDQVDIWRRRGRPEEGGDWKCDGK